MDVEKLLGAASRSVDAALDRYLPAARREPKLIHRAMRYSVFSGGKRVRPFIVIEACKACGAPARKALAAAAAVECVHTYSLIHDDLPSMDDDDYRRDKPSCHKAFGEAVAVLAGDALLTRAFGILARGLAPKAAAEAGAELARAIGTEGMVGGQAMDIARQGKRMTKKTLDRVNGLKTARLFEAAAKLGAIAAGASRAKAAAMASYGAAIGMAFQVVDDCLDGDGYAALMGTGRSRAAASAYSEKAKRSVRPFGRKAGVLNALADHLTRRIR